MWSAVFIVRDTPRHDISHFPTIVVSGVSTDVVQFGIAQAVPTVWLAIAADVKRGPITILVRTGVSVHAICMVHWRASLEAATGDELARRCHIVALILWLSVVFSTGSSGTTNLLLTGQSDISSHRVKA